MRSRSDSACCPYFPLASGVLTGKVKRGEAPPEGSRLNLPYFAAVPHDTNHTKVEKLEAWAAEHGRSLTEVALSYLASNPVTASVISGASSPEQVPPTPRRRGQISLPRSAPKLATLVA